MGILEDILYKNNDSEAKVDIDFAPFLGLMATLIPILLLTTAFLRLSSLNTKVPVIDDLSKVIKKNKKQNKDQKIALHVFLREDKVIVLRLRKGNKILKKSKIRPNGEEFNLEKFTKKLVDFKESKPNVFRAKIYPGSTVKYQAIVEIIDNMKISPEGEEFPIKDKDTGKSYNTVVMFDDVTFGNILAEEGS